MKINQNNFNHFFVSTKLKNFSLDNVETKNSANNLNGDVYQFHLEPKELKMFFEMAKEADVIREDKLKAIQEKMDNGTYDISGKDVVLKVLGEKVND